MALVAVGCRKNTADDLKGGNRARTASAATVATDPDGAVTQTVPDVTPGSQTEANASGSKTTKPFKKSGTPLKGKVDFAMTARLKVFVEVNQRMPGSLLELQGAIGDSLPRAPAGSIYVIDPVTIEVKLAPE